MSGDPLTPLDDPNPYAAPDTRAGTVDPAIEPGDDAEAIRRDHIQHEASIKAIGFLFSLGAFFLGIAAVVLLGLALSGQQVENGVPRVFNAAIGLVALAFTMLFGFAAAGLRRLRNWGRGIALVVLTLSIVRHLVDFGATVAFAPEMALPATVGLGIGLLISGYFISLLVSAKARTIFSPEYREIVQRTPHVKARTSPVAWIVLIVFLLIILGAILFAGMSG